MHSWFRLAKTLAPLTRAAQPNIWAGLKIACRDFIWFVSRNLFRVQDFGPVWDDSSSGHRVVWGHTFRRDGRAMSFKNRALKSRRSACPQTTRQSPRAHMSKTGQDRRPRFLLGGTLEGRLLGAQSLSKPHASYIRPMRVFVDSARRVVDQF